MKLTPLLAAGLLSAACLSSAIPSNAQTLHRTAPTIQRINSRVFGRTMLPQSVLPDRGTVLNLGPGQTRTLGVGTVTAIRSARLAVRFMSGTTGFITMTPRTLQLSRLHTGSRIMAILRSDGSVLIFPMSRVNSRIIRRPTQ